MTTYQFNRSTFLSALTNALPCVAPRSTLPVLSNVLLSESYICATDLAKSISMPLHNLVTPEPFAVCLPAKPLHEWLSATPASSAQLALSLTNTRASFTCGASKASFPTIVKEEFPPFPTTQDAIVTLPCSDLLSIVNRGVSTRDTEHFLLQLSPLLAASAQSACIVECKSRVETAPNLPRVVLPIDALPVLTSFLSASMDVSIYVSSNMLHLSRSDGATLYLTVLEQKFPTYEIIFNENTFPIHYAVSLADLKVALKTLRPFAASLPMITINADTIGKQITIRSRESSETGSGEYTIPMISSNFDAPFENSMSINYLNDVLASIVSPNVLIKSTPIKENSWILTQLNDDDPDSQFRSMIAPMYLK